MRFDQARLDALRSAVDTGTFEAAARELRVTPSAISQRIRSLETETGRVLLQRSKPVRPTPSGEVLLRLARQVDALGRDADAALWREGASVDGDPDHSHDDDAPRLQPLPLAVNADSLATWLLPALQPLADEIAFELHRADESRTTELLREGAVMAAITTDPVPVQGCSSVVLGSMRYRPMASPAFVERWFGGDDALAALSRAPIVVFDRADELQHRYLVGRGVDPSSPPCHLVPSSADFVEAVRRGFGWGMVPDLQVHHDDPLVALDPTHHIDVVLHWQQWQLHTAALARTATAVRAAAARALRP
ncbi:LysR family transcriptional regulator ArgP [Herbiconiux sp. KACC 21604]|uniref:LysR family transcriptional regulator ArgP n=1 Tax=unclassified Herbiconiux TaxID=2618217 RepID=UPI00149235B8|nr:LysR family transcriptional regulator ArgP [Herbiconiux sp. SALV-R1]QJU54023.1 LysR family transcriptional regulator ArgP [Herbiconiux sp. SALV-R1]WPO85056.1 LysR family transcriptional regulator ArgP [Herbiconiux sp. KACC 21604]